MAYVIQVLDTDTNDVVSVFDADTVVLEDGIDLIAVTVASMKAEKAAAATPRIFVTKKGGKRFVREGVSVDSSRVLATADSSKDAHRIKEALTSDWSTNGG